MIPSEAFVCRRELKVIFIDGAGIHFVQNIPIVSYKPVGGGGDEEKSPAGCTDHYCRW